MTIVTKILKKFSLDAAVYSYLKDNPDKYKTLTDSDIQKLQICLLQMLKEIDCFCVDNGIKYALIGGNVLGKVRHNGFIPWDDDVDLVMPRNDYEKFKELFDSSDLQQKYILRGPGCHKGADYRCMKIYKKWTLMKPVLSKKNGENKVFIDVMPIDNVPENTAHRLMKALYSYLLISVLGCCEFKLNTNELLKAEMNKSLSGKINCALRTVFGTIFLIVPLEKWYRLFDESTVYEKRTGLVTIANGKLLYLGEIINEDVLCPFHRCEFEGINTWMINRPEEYLEHRYGNYHKIPSKENRESHCVEELNI